MKIRISAPTGPMIVKLKQIPEATRRAMSEAMNDAVIQAERDVVDEMKRVFDRPTPWALGGVTHDKASPTSLRAVTRIRGKAGSVGRAVPAESFLAAQIEGGQRRYKRFEVALYKAGVLPSGYYAVPAGGARLDPYGNMSAGQITQLLAYFEAFPPGTGNRSRRNTTAERRAQMADRRRNGVAFVAIKPGNRNLFPGIYEYRDLGRMGTGVRAVMIFVRRARYARRLAFGAVAEHAIDKTLPRRWVAEMRAKIGAGGTVR